MDINNLQTYYDKNFGSQLRANIQKEITKDAWFKPYLRFISYDDEIGWTYLGETFDNLQQIKNYIRKQID